MKKTLLVLLPFVALTVLTSCFKSNTEPVTGKNSSLKIAGIALNNLVGQGNVSLKGIARFEYRVQNVDTPSAPPTIITYTDTFDIADPRGYDQNYDFDTPDNTKSFVFDFKIVIGQGNAQSASIGKITYKRNGTTYLDNQGTFVASTSTTSFVLNTLSVNF